MFYHGTFQFQNRRVWNKTFEGWTSSGILRKSPFKNQNILWLFCIPPPMNGYGDLVWRVLEFTLGKLCIVLFVLLIPLVLESTGATSHYNRFPHSDSIFAFTKNIYLQRWYCYIYIAPIIPSLHLNVPVNIRTFLKKMFETPLFSIWIKHFLF